MEYLTVMKPIATNLDKLQTEKDVYMGVLFRTQYVMRTKFESLLNTNLKYTNTLVKYISVKTKEEQEPWNIY